MPTAAQLHGGGIPSPEEEASVETEDNDEPEDPLRTQPLTLPSIPPSQITTTTTSSGLKDTPAPQLETQGTILDLIENRQRALLQKRKSQEQLHFLLSQSPVQKLLKRSNTIGEDYFPKIVNQKDGLKASPDRGCRNLRKRNRHSLQADDILFNSITTKDTPSLISMLQTSVSQYAPDSTYTDT